MAPVIAITTFLPFVDCQNVTTRFLCGPNAAALAVVLINFPAFSNHPRLLLLPQAVWCAGIRGSNFQGSGRTRPI